jgi:predicted DNA-binding transcriptional regulator YafY
MSRNDQVKRQWFLIRKLEGSRGATLDELVAALPPDHACHSRTLRRDLEALTSDFPLYTDRAGGQTRWRLVEGFKAPALAFSPTELMSLVFSRDLMKPLDGTPMKDSLDAALNKVTSALPYEALAYVRQMQGYLSVGMGPHKSYREHRHTIEQLTRAIALKRTVQMRYYSASRNVTSRRDVDPYRLWYAAGALYLVGYCHRRRDVRMFAVDRVRALAITNRPCQLPLHFDLDAYLRDALIVMRGKPVEVELVFDRRTSAWVRDRQWHPSQRLDPMKGGALRMTLRVADTPELVGWILSFGSGVRVLAPGRLRQKIKEEAERILTQDVTSQ